MWGVCWFVEEYDEFVFEFMLDDELDGVVLFIVEGVVVLFWGVW